MILERFGVVEHIENGFAIVKYGPDITDRDWIRIGPYIQVSVGDNVTLQYVNGPTYGIWQIVENNGSIKKGDF